MVSFQIYIYTAWYDNLSEDQKKNINVLNTPENVTVDFVEGDFPPIPPLKDDEEVKLKPEESIAERAKLNPQKRKKNKIGLKILLAQIKLGNNSYKLKKWNQTNARSFVSAQ